MYATCLTDLAAEFEEMRRLGLPTKLVNSYEDTEQDEEEQVLVVMYCNFSSKCPSPYKCPPHFCQPGVLGCSYSYFVNFTFYPSATVWGAPETS